MSIALHATDAGHGREAAAAKPPPAWLNATQAAALLGIGLRTFHTVRQQGWFESVCQAREISSRSLRWSRDELLAAAMNAPRVTKKAEPEKLAASRERAAA